MTVINHQQDVQNLTLTFVVQFDADIERVWQIWEDPRQLERWWGPPTWPATFVRHEMVPGGESRYYMTGPGGEKSAGWWKTTAVSAPTRFAFEDGFAGEDGEPSGFLGSTSCTVTLEDLGGRTRMTTVTHFENVEQLQEMVKMGMEEGMAQAMGQIDGILAEPAPQAG
ncbi:SRPBCC domain-containing protein [Arthrobacter sp. JSM 101049]|uniref:SRPBCC family protein n=1 Tax=Arthrobacter sp. JSM 101049 TaxID=929097 RepID=UPI003566D446